MRQVLERVTGMQRDGSYRAADDSPHRSLTTLEVEDLCHMAERTTPAFGAHDAKWDDHHPIARAIWQERGVRPA